MCGIYGIISQKKPLILSEQQVQIKTLFQYSLSRGSEAAGLAIYTSREIHLLKTNKAVKKILKSKSYQELSEKLKSAQVLTIIGQTRMATHGSSNNQQNNQPVISDGRTLIGVHNGLIINGEKFRTNLNSTELDTKLFLDYLEKKITSIKNKQELRQIFLDIVQQVEGVLNIAIMLPTHQQIWLYSNNGSLYCLQKDNFVYFASEKSTLESMFKIKPQQVKNELLCFDIGNTQKIKVTDHSLLSKKNDPTNKNSLKKLQSHTINQKLIANIQRCSRCILPITTPLINFDRTGICNYCHEHQPIKNQGEAALESILSKYRRTDGQPDCLVAFSGGRDSSYGLHLLKTKFNMNPIAFTYDWGMISDLGRRNQARMLDKLEIEQVLVSADLAKKRKHIRQNILAWLKKPDLGMVPIFMQGDKDCEYYTDQAAKKYQLPLVIYCRGNELEKEEFKAGYCGIKDADPGGVIHHLSWKNKLKLLTYYTKQYFLNPSYINDSMFDVAFGYFSTYIKPHNYLYLWHYLPWEESKIIDTLTKQYDWELSDDTPTSWRIGDGTPAFYNYIYYQVQGFTENDSLRSRQIREGLISRKKALALVKMENQPQYKNLKWYFDTLDLDGDMVLKKVDEMKKKY